MVARQASSFARLRPRFKPQARVLVLCEDSKSSLHYLRDAARHFRSYAEVEVTHCGKTDPKGIVAEAAKRRLGFDEVYCAIDRDSHLGFNEALALAAAQKVGVIASYPCYEFWLFLHFCKSRAPYMAAGALSAADRMVRELRLQPGMKDYAKGSFDGLFGLLLTRLPEARQRAAEVLADALQDGEMNPSTRLHELITLFESLGTLRPAD